MRSVTVPAVPALVLALVLGGCFEPLADDADVSANMSAVETSRPASRAPSSASREAVADAGATPAAPDVIGLEGLGDLRIGQPLPRGGAWAERGAQTGDACRTVSSPAYPGVYAIVTDGRVRRITVGQRSDVELAEGIGVGATEDDVDKWFAGFGEEPHKYEEAPAKYLTAPNAASGNPALRFEIGRDGRVRMFHVGTSPVLGYVEGCA